MASIDDEKTASILSQAWLQSNSLEELELRLAVAGTSLEEARGPWSRANKDLLEIVYKDYLDKRQESIDLKKLMESKSRAAKLLPSKSKIETEGKLFYIIMWAVDSDGKTYYVRSGAVSEDADMSAFLGGRDAYEAEIAWTLLFELNSVLRH